VVHRFPEPRFLIDGYAHEERVTDDAGNTVTHEFEFFHVRGIVEDTEDPGAAMAFAKAENARNQGVAEELAFLGIPGFEAILQNWKTLLMDPNTLPNRPPTA
jgi:hypothetical protein